MRALYLSTTLGLACLLGTGLWAQRSAQGGEPDKTPQGPQAQHGLYRVKTYLRIPFKDYEGKPIDTQVNSFALSPDGWMYFTTRKQVYALNPKGLAFLINCNHINSPYDLPLKTTNRTTKDFHEIPDPMCVKEPQALAVRADGYLYLAGKKSVFLIDPTHTQWKRVAGGESLEPQPLQAAQGLDPLATGFEHITGLALNESGELFIAEAGRESLWKLDTAGKLSYWLGPAHAPGLDHADFSTFAGASVAAPKGKKAAKGKPVGKTGTPQQGLVRWQPQGLAFGPQGDLFVSDLHKNKIYCLHPHRADEAWGTGQPGHGDGPKAAVRFHHPRSLAVDSSGAVWVVDTEGHRLRRIRPDGQVETLVGDGVAGPAFGPERDGLGTEARLHHPRAVAVDRGGVVYVVDSDGYIRKVMPVKTKQYTPGN